MFIVKLVVNEKCDDDEKDVDIDENESDFCDDVYVDEVFVLSFFFSVLFSFSRASPSVHRNPRERHGTFIRRAKVQSFYPHRLCHLLHAFSVDGF